jgi:hypothetical protein
MSGRPARDASGGLCDQPARVRRIAAVDRQPDGQVSLTQDDRIRTGHTQLVVQEQGRLPAACDLDIEASSRRAPWASQ